MEAAGPEDIAVIAAYTAAAVRHDAEAASDVYTFPVAFISPQATRVVAHRDDLRDSLAAAYDGYKADGITDITFECGGAIALGERLRQVEVRWHARRPGGDTALDVITWYILRHTDEGWRIAASIRLA